MNLNGDMKVIVYDDTDMHYFSMHISNIGTHYEPVVSRGCDGTTHTGFEEAEITLTGHKIKREIELDPTTMVRIAKYNSEIELKELDAKIRVAKENLSLLMGKMKRFNDKYEEIIKFIDNDFEADECDDDW